MYIASNYEFSKPVVGIPIHTTLAAVYFALPNSHISLSLVFLEICNSLILPSHRPIPQCTFLTRITDNNNFRQIVLILRTANLPLFFTLAEFTREQEIFLASKS